FFDPSLVQTIVDLTSTEPESPVSLLEQALRGVPRPSRPRLSKPRLPLPGGKEPEPTLEEIGQAIESHYKEVFAALGLPRTITPGFSQEQKKVAVNTFFDALAIPPKFVIWSGVREHGFVIKPEDLLLPEGDQVPRAFD